MTYDEMIARGIYGTGKHLQMRQRMADYTVDGKRLGSIDWQTRSGVRRDRRLPKDAGEILGTASILSLLGLENVTIISLDGSGHKLERPDLDVKLSDNGTKIAVEQADVAPPAEAKHDAETGSLEAHFWGLLDNDKSFLESFGNNNVIVFLSSHLVGKIHIQGKAERQSIQAELERFFRSGEHIAGGSATPFSSSYPILKGRGATWHSAPFPIPEFSIGHTGSNGISLPDTADVTRVLDKHRQSASRPGYRSSDAWIMLLMRSLGVLSG